MFVHFDLFWNSLRRRYHISDVTAGVDSLRTCGPNKFKHIFGHFTAIKKYKVEFVYPYPKFADDWLAGSGAMLGLAGTTM